MLPAICRAIKFDFSNLKARAYKELLKLATQWVRLGKKLSLHTETNNNYYDIIGFFRKLGALLHTLLVTCIIKITIMLTV
jgi:hypothetical protein